MGRPKKRRCEAQFGGGGDGVDEITSIFSQEAHHDLDEAPNANDCYYEVLRRDQSCFGRIHASWLVLLEGVDRNGNSMNDSPSGFVGGEATADEIQTLASQLYQVKQQLNPAAQSCANEFNNCIAKDEASGMDDERRCSKTTSRWEFQEARRSCNPFEELGEKNRGGLNKLFMNRSAIKLANVDALLDFRLTKCADRTEPFLFADICGAPGGFSEYVMYRCHASGITSCRGYGMSLSGSNEHGAGLKWKLRHISQLCGDATRFRVCNGVDGTGDIYQWANVEALQQFIEEDSRGRGRTTSECDDRDGVCSDGKVHLVVADGGFDAQRDSDCQEELAQKLVVCQAAAAVALLKRKGTLLLKMFGFRTETTRCVMKSLFHVFQRITVLKPVSSRPASAERYVVFEGYEDVTGWDGLTWRNQMFLCDTTWEAIPDSEGHEARLVNHLNRIDRDILSLNLKACFEILSYLERKGRALSHGEDYNHKGGRHRLSNADIHRYRQAWRLAKKR